MTISGIYNLEHALFTRAEMERRWNATRDMMSEEGIDALMVTGEENFQYFAGARGGILGIQKWAKSFGHVCQILPRRTSTASPKLCTFWKSTPPFGNSECISIEETLDAVNPMGVPGISLEHKKIKFETGCSTVCAVFTYGIARGLIKGKALSQPASNWCRKCRQRFF